MKIVENEVEFEKFLELYKSTTPSIFYFLTDFIKHPHHNEISFLYVKMEDDYVLPFNHNDCKNLDKKYLELLKTDNKKYVWDVKSLKHIIDFNNMVDINTLYYLKYNKEIDLYDLENNTRQFYNSKFYLTEDLNSVIPLMKQIEFLENISTSINLDYSLENEDYNEISDALFNIENVGLYKESDLVYTQYNPFTATGRPSNRFGGVNYAALNKEDETRKAYTSRFGTGGKLVEFDYDAYHLRLIGEVVNYKFPDGSVHEHMSKFYGCDYQESKRRSFQYLYGHIPIEVVQMNPFFGKVQDFIDELWKSYKKDKYIDTNIYSRRIFSQNVSDMNKNKLFNYFIQSLETETNMKMLSTLFNTIKDYKSKLVLYNYDSFLFDFNIEDGVNYLKLLKNEIELSGKFPTSISWGLNYHEMEDITEKFVG
ncbi:hypothetical protein HN615_05805 [Candidatus Woesearchaeota archaeon]|nr:hypothetical protein [Candidatus Woesearchaeota archaeon]